MAVAPSPEVATPGPEVATPGPEVATPGPEVATPGPEVATPGPEVAPGAISVVGSAAAGAVYPVTLVVMHGVGAAAVLISNPVVTPGPGLSGWPPSAGATAARFRRGAIQVLRAGVAVRMAGVIGQPRAVRSNLENPRTAHGSHPAARARRGSPTAPEPAMRASGDAGKRTHQSGFRAAGAFGCGHVLKQACPVRVFGMSTGPELEPARARACARA